MLNQTDDHPPVLVVGAGPTGLATAAELVRHGVACRIVDKGSGPTPLSKATTVQARTLEVLDDLGVVDEVLAAGHKSHGVMVHAGEVRLLHFSYDELDSPFPFLVNIAQSTMEHILGGLATRLGITVEWNTELTSFTQDERGVTAALRHEGGQEETLRASWLVGCDGAHSPIRHSLNIPFQGHTYQQWFGLADVTIHWPLSHEELHIFVHPHGALFAIPMPGENRYRIIVEAEERAGNPELTLADFQTAMDERGLGYARLSDPGWMTPFKINARRAAKHRMDRAFLVGDAAHIHSPVGGQGMNTGVQDAYNLAWKLALVERGLARPALLDSYEAERAPVAEAVLRMTDRLTGLIIMHNSLGRELRNHVMPLLSGFEGLHHRIATQDAELDISYRSSPAVAEHHHGRFGPRRFAGGPRAGDRAPDAGPFTLSGQPVHLADILRGTRHTLLLFGGAEPTAQTWRQLGRLADRVHREYSEVIAAYHVIDGPVLPEELEPGTRALLDPEGALHHRYQAEGSSLYLIRPDGYIAFRSHPADEAALVGYLEGLFQPRPAAAV